MEASERRGVAVAVAADAVPHERSTRQPSASLSALLQPVLSTPQTSRTGSAARGDGDGDGGAGRDDEEARAAARKALIATWGRAKKTYKRPTQPQPFQLTQVRELDKDIERRKEIERLRLKTTMLDSIRREAREAEAKLLREREEEKRRNDIKLRQRALREKEEEEQRFYERAKETIEARRSARHQTRQRMQKAKLARIKECSKEARLKRLIFEEVALAEREEAKQRAQQKKNELMEERQENLLRRAKEQEEFKARILQEKAMTKRDIETSLKAQERENRRVINEMKAQRDRHRKISEEKAQKRRQEFMKSIQKEKRMLQKLREEQEEREQQERERLEELKELRAKEARMMRLERERQQQLALEKAQWEAARAKEMLEMQKRQAEEAEQERQRKADEEERRAQERRAQQQRMKEKERLKQEEAERERARLAQMIREKAMQREREKERRAQEEMQREIEEERVRQQRILFRKTLIDFNEADSDQLFDLGMSLSNQDGMSRRGSALEGSRRSGDRSIRYAQRRGSLVAVPEGQGFSSTEGALGKGRDDAYGDGESDEEKKDEVVTDEDEWGDSPEEITCSKMLAAFNKTTLHPFPRKRLLKHLGIVDEDGGFALTREAFADFVAKLKHLKQGGKL